MLKTKVPYQAALTTQCAVLREPHWIDPVHAEATRVPCIRVKWRLFEDILPKRSRTYNKTKIHKFVVFKSFPFFELCLLLLRVRLLEDLFNRGLKTEPWHRKDSQRDSPGPCYFSLKSHVCKWKRSPGKYWLLGDRGKATALAFRAVSTVAQYVLKFFDPRGLQYECQLNQNIAV